MYSCKCSNIVLNSNMVGQIVSRSDQIASKNKQQKLESDLTNFLKSFNINPDEMEKLKSHKRIHEKTSKFLQQAIGYSLNKIQENIAHKDLIYKVPLNPWILHYCVNCDTIVYAKTQQQQQQQQQLHTSSSINSLASSSSDNNSSTNYTILVNSNLLTNEEELNRLKNHQSYSKAFGILIIDRSIEGGLTGTIAPITPTLTATATTIKIGSSDNNNINKLKQNRFKNLTDIFNNNLQKEIYETDERIRRYTEYQLALLKSYREKSEEEYQILINLINQVPDEFKMIDAMIDNNLLGQNREDGIMVTDQQQQQQQQSVNIDNSSSSTTSLFTLKQQQILNLDTPPATPDSTPMSVGNSPTFRQQQQTTSSSLFSGQLLSGRVSSIVNNSGNLIAGIGGNDTIVNGIVNNTFDSDCLFEIDGMETTFNNSNGNNNLSGINTISQTTMSDVEEAEDAEDALGELDSTTIQIPRSNFPSIHNKQSPVVNIAKSLPISISTVPEPRFYINELDDDDDDDEIAEDSNIDIAASIKALARSVHGDTVFGDLPRPRFSTQI